MVERNRRIVRGRWGPVTIARFLVGYSKDGRRRILSIYDLFTKSLLTSTRSYHSYVTLVIGSIVLAEKRVLFLF